jgi:hypothetical protein
MAVATTTGSATTAECQDLKIKIDNIENQLKTWKNKKDVLLNDVNSNIGEVRTALDVVETLSQELLSLKTRQLELRCVVIVLSNDNQNILATSSVRRRKDQGLS